MREPVLVAAHADVGHVQLVHLAVHAAEPVQRRVAVQVAGGEEIRKRPPRQLGQVEQPATGVEAHGLRHAEGDRRRPARRRAERSPGRVSPARCSCVRLVLAITRCGSPGASSSRNVTRRSGM